MASNNLWPMLIKIIFPIPASFLLLICLPLSTQSRIMRWTRRLYDKIFSFQVLSIPLIYLIMAASCALFAAMCLETYGLRVREVNATQFDEKMNLRGRRWRAERNFYISFMFLSCSVLANRLRLMLKEVDSLNEQIREMRKR
ncbi:unnamed protein product [Ectocarpus sp. 12 AP-2014]